MSSFSLASFREIMMTKIFPLQNIPMKNVNILLVVLLIPVNISGHCNFPRSLQQDNPWISKHTQKEPIDKEDLGGTLTAYIKPSVIKAAICTKQSCDFFERKCIRRFSNGKYLVNHKNTKFITDKPHYMCMQFLQRSFGIMQIKVSDISISSDSNLCDDDNLKLDHWPLILSSARNVPLICPFQGNYKMQIRGKDGNICTDSRYLPSLRSECEKGNGILFDFENTSCNSTHLNMDHSQRVDCVAQWQHGSYLFVVLRSKEGIKSNEWCLRLNFKRTFQNIKNAVIFNDAVCDPGNENDVINKSSNYFLVSLQRIYNDVKCALTLSSTFGGSDFDKCHTLCDRCLIETKTCLFPKDMRGLWLLETFNGITYANITSKTLELPSKEIFHCLSSGIYRNRRYILLIQLNNECYPRYSCLDFTNPTNSVLQFRIGKSEDQPFLYLKDIWKQTCHESNFKVDIKAGEDFSTVEMPKLTLVKTESHLSINCQLSKSLGFSDGPLYFREGNICDGCLNYQHNIHSNKFDVNAFSNSRKHFKMSFQCIYSATLEHNTRAVITKSLDQDMFLCWIFQESDNGKKIYVLYSAFCDNFYIRMIQNKYISPVQNYLVSELQILNIPRASCTILSGGDSNFVVQDRCYLSRLFHEGRIINNLSDSVIEQHTITQHEREGVGVVGDNRILSDAAPTINVYSSVTNGCISFCKGISNARTCSIISYMIWSLYLIHRI